MTHFFFIINILYGSHGFAAHQLRLNELSMLSPPTFDHCHGFYETPFLLSIDSELSNVEIFFTRDGSLPTENHGIRYDNPIPIETTTVVRAVCVKAGSLISPSLTQTYIFLDDVLKQPNDPTGYPSTWGSYVAMAGTAVADYEMDPEITEDPQYAGSMKDALLSLPTISIVTDKNHLFSKNTDPETGGIYVYTGPPEAGERPGLGDGWERPASVEFFNAEGTESFQVNCGIRLQGGHSRRPEKSPKHSFRLVFKNEHGGPSKLEYPLFGEEAATRFNTVTLRAGFGNTWIHWTAIERERAQLSRDFWAKNTQLDMGHLSGHGRYAHLYINGLYWGVYNPTERIDGEFAASYLGGDPDEYDVIKDYASVVDGNIDAWNRMMVLAGSGMSNMENYQRIQGNNADGRPNPLFEAYVDIDNLIDYMILNFFGGNTDWDHHNWVAVRNRVNPGKGFQFFSWDAEHVLKDLEEFVIYENNPNCPSGLFQSLMENESFRRRFVDRVNLHCSLGGALTPEANLLRWTAHANTIEPAVIAESARWGDYRRDVHPWANGPYELYTQAHWLNEQDFRMNVYFPERTEIFIDQLRGAGFFPGAEAPGIRINNAPFTGGPVQAGDKLSLYSPAGMIYFTTDGSDPFKNRAEAGIDTRGFDLVSEQADKRVLVPQDHIDSRWRSYLSFDDSGWKMSSGAPGGIGYDREGDYLSHITLNLETDMTHTGSNPNTSCYVRIPFTLNAEKLKQIRSLQLYVRYDDGFAAYLNGAKIAEANAPALLSWNSAASAGHEAEGSVAYPVSQFIDRLKEGDNLLAIHGLNASTTSSDFIINARLSASDQDGASGSVSPNARIYENPIILENSIRIKARSYFNNSWSALTECVFPVSPHFEQLKFTELHYHPMAQESSDDRLYEFIELKNIGPYPIDLSGARFTDGISFTFPDRSFINPHEYIVIVSNTTCFQNRYGLTPFGQFTGNLSNAGEKLLLVDAAMDTVLFLDYDDESPWPRLADGGGYSLVPLNRRPEEGQNAGNLWLASRHIHGSPGQDDEASDVLGEDINHKPERFILYQNYPNPFNPSTTIRFALSRRSKAKLVLFDLLGNEVITLVNTQLDAGDYQIVWETKNIAAGIYVMKLVTREFIQSRKMILLK